MVAGNLICFTPVPSTPRICEKHNCIMGERDAKACSSHRQCCRPARRMHALNSGPGSQHAVPLCPQLYLAIMRRRLPQTRTLHLLIAAVREWQAALLAGGHAQALTLNHKPHIS